MKKKSRFKVVFIIIIGMILLALPIAMQVKGEVSSKMLNKYVAIGDEISIESNDDYDVEYVSLIKDFLYALNNY